VSTRSQIPPELVWQEVASLYRFIEPIIKGCADLRDDYPVYTPPSREFFTHIQTLGTETLKFLETFPQKILKDPRTASSKRQKLFSLKAAWEDLHEYVKPALDADSLHLPTPLITALHDRLHENPKWRGYRFTLFHTIEANYFEIPGSGARNTANRIADLIEGTAFPPSLGLLGIPYSQGDGFFLNCSLAHEIGHFIYQEDSSAVIASEIDNTLQRMTDEIGELEEQDTLFCTELLSTWTEEIFCDLFAITQIGPAYAFALSQLIGASFLIGQSDGEPADFYSFTLTHPAEVSRIQAQQKLLDRLGWWQVIKDWKSAPVKVLHRCSTGSALYTVESAFPTGVTQERFLQCHNEMCDYLIDYLMALLPKVNRDVRTFKEQAAAISEYLRRAVVPSTIVIDGKDKYPSSMVLLNAGFRFMLEDLSLLFNNIQESDSSSIEQRSRFIKRIELWLLKALEDCRLLTHQVD
jgi:hypothetical protein